MKRNSTASVVSDQAVANRWTIAIMGTLLQVSLGTVYAWSYFQKPIMAANHWTNSQTMWIFSLAICSLGLSAAWAGVNLSKFGPTRLAMAGGFLYGTGSLLLALALKQNNLIFAYIAYGGIGGIGLGLGYVTPVATVAKWFPDKKGFITGMVVMGFGLGALLMSKVIAPSLMAITNGDLPKVFMSIGGIMLLLTTAAGAFMRNPPNGYVPTGYTPTQSGSGASLDDDDLTARDCILSRRFAVLWLFFFANICVGIMFIGLQSPMLQDLLKASGRYSGLDENAATVALASAGATLIAISSLFNGVGRFFWGGLSDKIGRLPTFRLILASQILVFVALLFVESPWLFGALVCYVLLCYGGGFGTAPSTVLTLFGPRLMPVVYGTLLTAWAAGGILGPQMAAMIKDRYAAQAGAYTFGTGATILALGLILAFMISDRPFSKQARTS